MTADLCDDTPHWRPLPDLPGATLRYAPRAIADHDAWFARLRDEVTWERHRITMFGREIDSPRLSSWVGDADAVYTYSRTRFEPHPWTPALAALRDAVSRWCDAPFNSVLCNLYRSGADSMGWHSDAEPELGPDPVIASLSFGAVRRFRLRHRHDASRARARTAARAGQPAGHVRRDPAQLPARSAEGRPRRRTAHQFDVSPYPAGVVSCLFSRRCAVVPPVCT